jgi:hypothetical protein
MPNLSGIVVLVVKEDALAKARISTPNHAARFVASIAVEMIEIARALQQRPPGVGPAAVTMAAGG